MGTDDLLRRLIDLVLPSAGEDEAGGPVPAVVDPLAAADRAAAANQTPYEISNVEVAGNTVSWDNVWTNGNGASYCAEGHKAVIEDGTIVSWEFAPNPHPCP